MDHYVGRNFLVFPIINSAQQATEWPSYDPIYDAYHAQKLFPASTCTPLENAIENLSALVSRKSSYPWANNVPSQSRLRYDSSENRCQENPHCMSVLVQLVPWGGTPDGMLWTTWWPATRPFSKSKCHQVSLPYMSPVTLQHWPTFLLAAGAR